MPAVPDRDEQIEAFRAHVVREAQKYMPTPVTISVFDTTDHLNTGYVWGTLGTKTVKVRVPTHWNYDGVGGGTNALILAWPVNPNNPGDAEYIAVMPVIDGATGSRIIGIRGTGFEDDEGNDITDHGNLSGLDDDDHSQYHNDARGDARYYQQTSFLDSSAGAGDAGKPIKLDAAGHVDASMINDADIDLANASGTLDISDQSNLSASDGVQLDGDNVELDINGLDAQGSPTAAADYVAIYDAGLTAHRKVLLEDLPSGGGSSIDIDEDGASVITGIDKIDFKDQNVEDGGSDDAHVYLDLMSICQGRLTLSTGVPVVTSDVTAATTLYFTPYKGDKIALYDGTRWKVYAFTERSISIPATTGTNYDVFLYDNSGTLTLELTAWTNDTTRATALTTQDGVYVKTGATTRRYLGSIRTTDASGECEFSATKAFVWNYYNRVRWIQGAQDNTSHTYASSTWRSWNNDATLRVEHIIGVSEDSVGYSIQGRMKGASNGDEVRFSIGLDETDNNSLGTGYQGENENDNIMSTATQSGRYPGIGYHYGQAVERCRVGTGTFETIAIEAVIWC